MFSVAVGQPTVRVQTGVSGSPILVSGGRSSAPASTQPMFGTAAVLVTTQALTTRAFEKK